MANRKLTKTVTVSLVALAAATGAAVLSSGEAAAAPRTDTVGGPVPVPYPNVGIPGLTNPLQKIEQKLPGLKIPAFTNPAIKIALKLPAQKIAGVIHQLPGDIGTDLS